MNWKKNEIILDTEVLFLIFPAYFLIPIISSNLNPNNFNLLDMNVGFCI